MKTRNWLTCLAAVVVAVPSYGAVVNAPWSPDGGAGTAEKNLYEILGVLNNALVQEGALQKFGTTVVTSPAGPGDEIWSTGIGGQYSSILIEMAGSANVNTFGVYDVGDNTRKLEIFSGADNPGTLAKQVNIGGDTISVSGGGSLTLLSSGTQFGFYLFNGLSGATYYSQKSLNGGSDQMVGFDVNTTKFGLPPYPSNTGWVLAWEDVLAGDRDFNDMVLSLTSVPIPEPATLIAGALLLLPFGASTLRFVRKNQVRTA